MTDEEFARLVDELDEDIVSNADEDQAQVLIGRFVAAVDEGEVRGDAREIQCPVERRIAAADDDQALARE